MNSFNEMFLLARMFPLAVMQSGDLNKVKWGVQECTKNILGKKSTGAILNKKVNNELENAKWWWWKRQITQNDEKLLRRALDTMFRRDPV